MLGNPESVTTNVGSKLTLNFGIRFESESGLKAQENALLVGFDRNASFSLAAGGPTLKGAVMYAGANGYPTETGNVNKLKFSPRFGAAYRLNTKTTVRGGYGLFWAPIPYGLQTPIGYTQTNTIPGSLDGNNTATVDLANPYPNGLLKPAGNSLGYRAGVGSTVSTISALHKSPYVHQFSLDIQRELGWGKALVVGNVGTVSKQMVLGVGGVNINQLPASSFGLGVAGL